MKNFVIEPLKGFGEIPFGMSLDEAVKLLGSPNFYEELSDMEETGNRSIFYEPIPKVGRFLPISIFFCSLVASTCLLSN